MCMGWYIGLYMHTLQHTRRQGLLLLLKLLLLLAFIVKGACKRKASGQYLDFLLSVGHKKESPDKFGQNRLKGFGSVYTMFNQR